MNGIRIKLTRLGATVSLLFVAACSDNESMVELQDYVRTVVNRPPGQIEPLPEFVSYESFTYSAASLRSPFEIPVDITSQIRNQQTNDVKPDENRPREPLENYSLGSLTMTGTIARGGRTWALIRDENGLITRVTEGNYMGRNHGRIVSVSQTQIDLIEIVPTGDGGWIERPETVVLQQ